MEVEDSDTLLDRINAKYDKYEMLCLSCNKEDDGYYIRMRALLVALLGMSVSACVFASPPVEMELEDEELLERLNSVGVARRFTKPVVRFMLGSNRLSASVTALSSVLLMVAAMTKHDWWHRGMRWLAAPALMMLALEVASDVADAMLSTALLISMTAPFDALLHAVAATLLLATEVLIWYFIAKFFEQNSSCEVTDEN